MGPVHFAKGIVTVSLRRWPNQTMGGAGLHQGLGRDLCQRKEMHHLNSRPPSLDGIVAQDSRHKDRSWEQYTEKAAAGGSSEAGLSTAASQKCPCPRAGCRAGMHTGPQCLPEKGSARHQGSWATLGLGCTPLSCHLRGLCCLSNGFLERSTICCMRP